MIHFDNTHISNIFKRLFLIFAIAVFISSDLSASSQYFGMSRPDISNYPFVRASFSAINSTGQYYSDLTPNDFIIYENEEQIPTGLIQVDCEDQVPVDLLLVLDQSTSMGEEVDGKRKWDWVVESVQNFIEDVDMPDGSTIGITTFHSKPYLRANFTSDKSELKESIASLQPVMAPTNFNTAFQDPNVGAIKLLSEMPYDHKRIVIMLSDGHHTKSLGDFKFQEIKEELITNNIICFTITYLEEETSTDLQNIANGTGGEYQHVTAAHQLDDIYSMIADLLFSRPLCFLSWKSTLSCDPVESFRNLSASCKLIGGSKVEYQYISPEWSIFAMDTDKEIYDFGNPEIDEPVVMDIILMPSLDVKISDFIMNGSEYFKIVDYGNGSAQKPNYDININGGETKTIKVQFTQKAQKDARFGILYLEATPCPLEIPLRAGREELVITKPTAGELFSACNQIDIEWKGVPDNKQISLFYSTDDGTSWQQITNNAINHRFQWTPPINGAKYKIRGLAEYNQEYKWLTNDGGLGNETVNAISAQDNELFYSVCGEYTSETTISGKTCKHEGGTDWFVARYDAEGNNRWINYCSGEHNETAPACITDPLGNVYVAGRAYSGMSINGSKISLPIKNIPYSYIAKFSPFGNLLEIEFLSNPDYQLSFESRATKLGFSFDGTKEARLVVQGRYLGQYRDNTNAKYLPEAKWEKDFTAVYSTNLELVKLTNVLDDFGAVFSNKTVTFPSRTQYRTDTFSDSYSVGDFTVNSNGGSDFWVSKQAVDPDSEGLSAEFEVDVPQIDLLYNKFIKDSIQVMVTDDPFIDCDSVLVGVTNTIVLEKIITNTSKLPVTLISANVTGEMADCFEIDPANIGLVIQPNSEENISIIFHPTDEGDCKGLLTINGDCGNPVELNLIGVGLCGAETADTLDFGQVSMGITEEQTFKRTFKNPMTTSIVIRPSLEVYSNYVGHDSDFELITPQEHERIEVMPFDSVDFTIKFSPSEMGRREVYINYNASEECEVPNTIITGEGKSGKLDVKNINWGRKRINTTYEQKYIEITNLGHSDKVITNIDIDDNYSNIFVHKLSSMLPLTVKAKSSERIEIDFVPPATGKYETEITLYTDEEDKETITLYGDVYLPEMNTDTDCAEDVNIGETAISSITITNPSTSSNLSIHSITIGNTEEFMWKGSQPTNDSIRMGSEKTFYLNYAPTATGKHSTQLIILADDYDGTFGSDWKETIAMINCDALQLEITDPPLQSGLLCENHIFNIEVENTSKETDAICYLEQAEFSGKGSEYCSTNNTEITIVGNTTEQIPLYFKCDIEGEYTIDVIIPTSASTPIRTQIKAIVQGIELKANKERNSLNPGEEDRLEFITDIPATTKGTVEEFNFTIKHDNQMIILYPDAFQSMNDNVTWETPVETENEISIKGNGKINLPFNDALFSMKYQALLDTNYQTQINYKVDYECTEREFDVCLIQINEICMSENRRLIFGDTPDVSASMPNPANEKFDLTFTVAFDAIRVTIDVFNSSGKRLAPLLDKTMDSGTYTMTFSTADLDNGVYFLKYKAANYSKDIKLIIEK